MADQSVIRIHRELREFERTGDLSIAAAFKDEDIRKVRALIVGPPETPYEFGFYEFNVKFPKEYPTKAPSVTAITTNLGHTRFNPNIYAGGKVCLSILGTWRGERGEEWSSAQGLESILISIQSLLSGNPYENEPGFENVRGDDDRKNAVAYADKIRHESLRISVIERMENYLGINRKAETRLVSSPNTIGTSSAGSSTGSEDSWDVVFGGDAPWEPHRDKCKLRFLWYYDSYHATVDEEAKKHKDGEKFEKMPFEAPGNTMDGQYSYTELKKRLTAIKEAMDVEVERWAREGLIAVKRELSIANNLKRQYEQAVALFKTNDVPVDIELMADNPFVWLLTLVGRPNTPLDGGLFKIKICVSPQFPAELPRVRVETPMFHHRVSANGLLCYLIKNSDYANLAAHVQAIISALEDDNPAYDPRTRVHPEASRLLWGSADDKKIYRRRLQRSVQDSWEYVDLYH
jgi:ubiquitin-conjugating enzyme E2 Z